MAVLIKRHPEEFLIGSLFVGQQDQIGEQINGDWSFQANCIVLPHIVFCFSLNNISEFVVDGKESLLSFLVFDRLVVFFVYFMIEIDSVSEVLIVRMRRISFGPIVSEEQVVLQRSLERLAYKILECDNSVRST